jgi:hypothetical protein
MGGTNARRRLLRASFILRQFRIRQWHVLIGRQFIGFVELLRFLFGKFVFQ